jgi:hypothetical protein
LFHSEQGSSLQANTEIGSAGGSTRSFASHMMVADGAAALASAEHGCGNGEGATDPTTKMAGVSACRRAGPSGVPLHRKTDLTFHVGFAPHPNAVGAWRVVN